MDNLNLPFADDSNAVTPCSDDLCNLPAYKHFLNNARRSSFASRRSFCDARSRRNSIASLISRASRSGRRQAHHSPLEKPSKLENPWNWNKAKGDHHLPEVVVDKTKSDDNVSYSDLNLSLSQILASYYFISLYKLFFYYCSFNII